MRKLYQILPTLIFAVMFSSVAFACDSCDGHNSGDTWYRGSGSSRERCTCNTCSPQLCIASEPGHYFSQDYRCVTDQDAGGSYWRCDMSCPHNGNNWYTSCSPDPEPVNPPTCTGANAVPIQITQIGDQRVMVGVGVSNATGVWAEVWSESDGSSDKRNYNMTKKKNADYYYKNIDMDVHPGYGRIFIRTHMRNADFSDVICGTISINRVPTAQISGYISKLKNSALGCDNTNIETYTGLSGVTTKWQIDGLMGLEVSSTVGADGKYNLVSNNVNTPLQFLYLTNFTAPVDYKVDPECVVEVLDNSGVTLTPAPGYLGFQPAASNPNMTGLNSFNLVYALRYMVGGWITSLEGDVYSGGDISQSVPFTPSGGFAGVLLEGSAYAFANNDIDVGTVGGTPQYRVFEGSNSGSVENMITVSPFSFAISGYNPSTPGTASQFPVDLDMMGLWNIYGLGFIKPYVTSVSEFNQAMKSHNAPYVEYSVVDGGTAVVYLDGSGTLELSKELRSVGGRLLIITKNNVKIDKSIGYASPTSSDVANIDAFVLTPKDITIESTGDKASERTLIVEGSLVSTEGKILQKRDRGLDNQYPSLVVRYDPMYLYGLTEQEQSARGEDYPGLFVNSIDW